MTVAELVAHLQSLPQEMQVLTYVQDDYAPVDPPRVDWARSKANSTGWWQLYWGVGSPKFSMGFEEVVIIS